MAEGGRREASQLTGSRQAGKRAGGRLQGGREAMLPERRQMGGQVGGRAVVGAQDGISSRLRHEIEEPLLKQRDPTTVPWPC